MKGLVKTLSNTGCPLERFLRKLAKRVPRAYATCSEGWLTSWVEVVSPHPS